MATSPTPANAHASNDNQRSTQAGGPRFDPNDPDPARPPLSPHPAPALPDVSDDPPPELGDPPIVREPEGPHLPRPDPTQATALEQREPVRG
jgi:hypothetical protein